METLEDKLERRKRIFNETAPAVANLEIEDIKKLIDQTVIDVEMLREKEAALRRIFADRIQNMKDDRLQEIRSYIPIPPSVYKDDDQERRTRPSRIGKNDAQDSSDQPKRRAQAKSPEEKNLENIRKALQFDTIEEAANWMAAQKARATQQPNNENK